MKFENSTLLTEFVKTRWLPYKVEYDGQAFYYEGSIKELAAKLLPEIKMVIHPDAGDWGADEEDIGMVWESGFLSIDASPIDTDFFMILVSEVRRQE